MPNPWLNVGHIIPMGQSDLLADDKEPKYAKGILSFTRDAFGLRIFQYLRNSTSSAVAVGELTSRAATTTITDATSGTTTSVTKTGAGWTVDAFKDRLLHVTDNDDASGAAPEGETSVIGSNTATVAVVDSTRAFSAAIAVNDDLVIYSLFDLADAADGDLARDVAGVWMAAVSTLSWGMVQRYGFCPQTKVTAAAIVAGDPVVAGANAVAAFGTDGQELWVGWSPVRIAADVVNAYSLIFIDVFSPAGPGTAP